MARFKPPKGIVNHAAVEECLSGYSGGFDYKYDVFLKEGYVFSRGRMEGSRQGCFNTVADFLHAEPIKVQKYRCIPSTEE